MLGQILTQSAPTISCRGPHHRLRSAQGHRRQAAAARRLVQARATRTADPRRAQRRRQDDAAAHARRRDVPAAEAAAVAAHLHGRAGQLAAERGPLLAGDLVRRLPEAIAGVSGAAGGLGDSRRDRSSPRRGAGRPRRHRRQHRRPARAAWAAPSWRWSRPTATGTGWCRRPGRAGRGRRRAGRRRGRGGPRAARGGGRPPRCWPGCTGRGRTSPPRCAADVEVSVNAEWGLAEVVGAARATGRTARLHLFADTGLSREGATRADWPGLCAAAAKAQADGEVAVVGLWSHLAYADAPDPPDDRRAGGRLRGGGRRSPGHAGLTDARPAPGQLRGDHRRCPAPGTTSSARGSRSTGCRPRLGGDPAAYGLRPAMTVARPGRARQAGAGRCRGLLRAHLLPRPARPPWRWCRVGYADGVPRGRQPRAGARCRRAAHDRRAGSAWTSSSSTSGDDAVAPRATRCVLWGPGDAGRAHRAGVGRRARHHPLRAGDPDRRPVHPRATSAPPGRTDDAADSSSRPAHGAGLAGGAARPGRGRRRRGVAASRSATRRAAPRAAPADAARRRAARRRPARPGRTPRRPHGAGPADDGVVLHVEEVGPPRRAADLVFVHGYALSMASWTFQRQAVWHTAAGHRQRAPAAGPAGLLRPARARLLRARRRPSTPRSSSSRRDLDAVLQATGCRAGPVVLVGHSMGGMTIMGAGRAAAGAVRHPGRRRRAGVHLQRQPRRAHLRAARGAHPVRERGAAVRARGRCAHRPRFAERTRRLGRRPSSPPSTWSLSFSSTDVDPRLGGYVDAMIAGTPVDVIAEFYPALAGHGRARAPWSRCGGPAAGRLTGDKDTLIPKAHSERSPRRWAASATARVVVVHDAGHMVPLEQPAEVTLHRRRCSAGCAELPARALVTARVDAPRSRSPRVPRPRHDRVASPPLPRLPACPELAAARQHVVVGDVPAGAPRFALVGEAPGAHRGRDRPAVRRPVRRAAGPAARRGRPRPRRRPRC